MRRRADVGGLASSDCAMVQADLKHLNAVSSSSSRLALRACSRTRLGEQASREESLVEGSNLKSSLSPASRPRCMLSPHSRAHNNNVTVAGSEKQ